MVIGLIVPLATISAVTRYTRERLPAKIKKSKRKGKNKYRGLTGK